MRGVLRPASRPDDVLRSRRHSRGLRVVDRAGQAGRPQRHLSVDRHQGVGHSQGHQLEHELHLRQRQPAGLAHRGQRGLRDRPQLRRVRLAQPRQGVLPDREVRGRGDQELHDRRAAARQVLLPV